MNEKKPDKIIALYEDGRTLASIAAWSVDLQVKRLRSNDTYSSEFVMQPLADFHFLVTALTRLRRSAELILKISDISGAINKFDQNLPDLIGIRNVLEHIDDYTTGEGRNKNIDVRGLQTIVLGETIEWLEYKINLDDAIKSSAVLFREIQENPPLAYIEKCKKHRTQQNQQVS